MFLKAARVADIVVWCGKYGLAASGCTGLAQNGEAAQIGRDRGSDVA